MQSADTVVLAENVAAIFFDFARQNADKQQGNDINLIKQQLTNNKNIALIVNLGQADIHKQWPSSSLIICGS